MSRVVGILIGDSTPAKVIRRQRDQLRRARADIDERDLAIGKWTRWNAEQDEKIRSLTKQLDEELSTHATTSKVLDAALDDVTKLTRTVDEQLNGLKARDGSIAALGREVAYRDDVIASLERELRAAHRALVKLTHGAGLPGQIYAAEAPMEAGAPRT